MDRNGYYYDCLADAASERGLDLAQADLKYLADAVAGAAENYGTAFYTPDSPLIGENKRLAADLKVERSKVQCRECNGSGTITTRGPHHSSTSQCWKCRGDGKVTL